jgi:hypothetical protein
MNGSIREAHTAELCNCKLGTGQSELTTAAVLTKKSKERLAPEREIVVTLCLTLYNAKHTRVCSTYSHTSIAVNSHVHLSLFLGYMV